MTTNIQHKQLLGIPNTTAVVGTSSGWMTMWGGTRVAKAAGWKYAGSSDGVTKDASADPALDFWNTAAGVGTLVTSGAAAIVGTPARGRAPVSGLAGITSAMKGMFLTISGSVVPANNHALQIEEVIDANNVMVDARNFAVAADPIGRAWTVRDPIGSNVVPPALTAVACWWCGVGPATIRIPLTAYPSGRFGRGEQVIQATTGFVAEFRDLVWNPTTGVGYLVVWPQVRGTGLGVYGLTAGLVLTGQTSGATATQVGTAAEFRAEMVIYKQADDIFGQTHYGFFDTVADAAQRFSFLCTQVDCTELYFPGSGPGMGGGTNPYPTFAMSAWGNNADVTPPSPGNGGVWLGSTATLQSPGNGFAVCADAIEEDGYSADGSWTAGTLLQAGNAWSCHGFHLVEGGDADLAPWVSLSPGGSQQTVFIQTDINRQTARVFNTISSFYQCASQALDVDNSSKKLDNSLRGWARRGWGGTKDFFSPYHVIMPQTIQNSIWTQTFDTNNGADLGSSRLTESMNVPGQTVLFPFFIGMLYSQAPSAAERKLMKGAARWLRLVDNGHMGTMHDQGLFYQLAGVAMNMACGPFNSVAPTLSSTQRLYMQVNTGSTLANRGGQQEAIDGTILAPAIPVDPGSANWTNQLDLTAQGNQTTLTRYRSMLKANAVSAGFPKTATLGTRGQLRFYSAPLAAQTISGTVKGQFMAIESAAAANVWSAARLYVMGADGTLRGVLRELLSQFDISGGLEFALVSTNRKIFRDGTLTPVICLAGDQIVFELGWRVGVTSGTASFVITNNGGTDLAENEVDTTAGRNSWIEFSGAILYQADKQSTVVSFGNDLGGAASPAPAPSTSYQNRVFDSVANAFVFWITPTPDTTGTFYPGPGVFGVTTSNYIVTLLN